ANPAAQRLTGCRPQQLRGRALTELIDREDDRNLTELLGACQTTTYYVSRDGYVLRTSEGQTRAVQLSVSPIRTEPEPLTLLVVRDLSPHKQTERLLRESEERFRHLSGAIDQVFWFVAHHPLQILYVSPAFEAIWGFSVEQLLRDPHSWQRSVLPEDR